MLTQETASAIYFCRQNILNAQKLLTDMAALEEQQKKSFPDRQLRLKDVFGRERATLELGVPSGNSGHRIFNVEYDLAKIIIEAQIKSYETSLAALNVLAAKECLSSINQGENDERSVAPDGSSEKITSAN